MAKLPQLVECYVCHVPFNPRVGKVSKNPPMCMSCKKGAPSIDPPMPEGVILAPPDIPTTLPTVGLTSLSEVKGDFRKLEKLALDDTLDTLKLDRKITLLARLIMEDVLWNSEGLAKKDKFDIAVQAIRVIEGGKQTIWQAASDDKGLPKSQQQFFAEKERIEKRIVALVDKYKGGKVSKLDLVDGAVEALDINNELEGLN